MEPDIDRPSAAIRLAALSFISDAGFGVATPLVLWHLSRHGELPMTPWGFRALAGPFDDLGEGTFAALGWTFVGVCALNVLSGIWLWRGRRRGATLGLAMSPFAVALGAGFALPFLLVALPIRAALVLAGRRSLH
jgi:hypothetical protein